MVTADDVCRVAIFAGLAPADCERLARAAADIALLPGEYAAHEGADRALFAVLDGKIEAVKLVDGIERVVGERGVGDIFGEVPITLGTVFPVGFRAAVPSRVLRIEPHDYHAVAADVPGLTEEVGKLARERMSGARGLQGLAAAPSPPRAIIVGSRFDASCADLRRFLDRNLVTFEWLFPDAPDAEAVWGGPLPAAEELPAVKILDTGTVVRPLLRQVAGLLDLDDADVLRPQLRRVAEGLGLATEPAADDYDVVVVGAGPAGLAAAVYGASEGLRTLVIDEGFGSLDDQGRDRLVEAIQAIQPEFEKILIITHLSDFKDLFPTRIEVTKTPVGSTIEVT